MSRFLQLGVLWLLQYLGPDDSALGPSRTPGEDWFDGAEGSRAMTAAEWESCADVGPMLDFLRGRASDRKLRLFACACCRRIWHLLRDVRSRRGLEVAEEFGEGQVNKAVLRGAWKEAHTAWERAYYHGAGDWTPAEAAHCAAYPETKDAVDGAVWYTGLIAVSDRNSPEPKAQCSLLRDLFGPLPFRPVTLDPAWLTPTVVSLSQAAYDQRELPSGHLDSIRLAVLADALEDAGCDNANILSHCRGPNPHARGCWVLDLILGKE